MHATQQVVGVSSSLAPANTASIEAALAGGYRAVEVHFFFFFFFITRKPRVE